MAGGIEQSQQFWAIQHSKPRSQNWRTLQLSKPGDISTLTLAGQLQQKTKGTVRVVPVDRDQVPTGPHIPFELPKPAPVEEAPKPAAPSTLSNIKGRNVKRETAAPVAKKPKEKPLGTFDISSGTPVRLDDYDY
jgi:hypothetical protein